MRVPVRLVIVAALAAEVLGTVLVVQQIGAWSSLVLFAASFVLGLLVMRRAGGNAWLALTRGADRPGAVAGDTVLLFLAGLLLAVPGVLTDLVGLVLLLPPVRELVRRWVARGASRRFPDVQSMFTTVRLADGSLVIPGEVVDDGPPAGGTAHRRDDDGRSDPPPLPR